MTGDYPSAVGTQDIRIMHFNLVVHIPAFRHGGLETAVGRWMHIVLHPSLLCETTVDVVVGRGERIRLGVGREDCKERRKDRRKEKNQ
jgi:hypothetical protein